MKFTAVSFTALSDINIIQSVICIALSSWGHQFSYVGKEHRVSNQHDPIQRHSAACQLLPAKSLAWAAERLQTTTPPPPPPGGRRGGGPGSGSCFAGNPPPACGPAPGGGGGGGGGGQAREPGREQTAQGPDAS